jgi:hypothetical protein
MLVAFTGVPDVTEVPLVEFVRYSPTTPPAALLFVATAAMPFCGLNAVVTVRLGVITVPVNVGDASGA